MQDFKGVDDSKRDAAEHKWYRNRKGTLAKLLNQHGFVVDKDGAYVGYNFNNMYVKLPYL